MNTPIFDFVARYQQQAMTRAHMPGHKGTGPLGCEGIDITEIAGADSLYEADGIIAESEKNATALFGTAATFYSTEGSSQCIRAMLYLAMLSAPKNQGRPVVVAARNAHKVFLLAAALLDFDVVWLWPEGEEYALCSCPVSPEQLRATLLALPNPPAAVYLTTPDYLGGMLDLPALAAVCHSFGAPLLVDNAHGAYLRFLPGGLHPMQAGADLCCDSAHKTLPVLTGGAYLHISQQATPAFVENGRRALALFGSTSPSYLILQSLDLVNRYLHEEFPAALAACVGRIDALKSALCAQGWVISQSDPLKLTIAAAKSGWDGRALAARLRERGVECEYADPDFLVLMLSPQNSDAEIETIDMALGQNPKDQPLSRSICPLAEPRRHSTPREALFSISETIPAAESQGRVLAAPTVGCPPAVPIVVSGEVIGADAVALFSYYGVDAVEVLTRCR